MNKLDITSTAVEKGLDMVKGFVEKLAGGAIEEAGLLFADKVRLRRVKNQIKILEKAQQIAKDKKINIRQINLKVLVPLLENCSLEEDETLQEKWANLIANYADSNQVYKSSVFPYILGQISTEEIQELQRAAGKVLFEHDTCRLKLSSSEINNLERLGLIANVPDATFKKGNSMFGSGDYIKVLRQDKFTITHLAREFILCCSSPTDTVS